MNGTQIAPNISLIFPMFSFYFPIFERGNRFGESRHSRGVRNYSQNKVGHHSPEMGRSVHTQKSFLYLAINTYNKLPRNLTLIRNLSIFKKWLKLFNMNNAVKLRNQPDNSNILEIQNIDENIIEQCQNLVWTFSWNSNISTDVWTC